MPCRMKKARGPRREALPWWRMRHEDLGMPLPAVYLPQRGLRADTRGTWGFVPIMTMTSDNPIPYARHEGLVLAADIAPPDGMVIVAVPDGVVTGAGEVIAAGRFNDPHPAEWTRAAHSAGSLLLVIGPDDAPVLDAAKARDDPQDALAHLWTFTSAIAAVHVIMPAR